MKRATLFGDSERDCLCGTTPQDRDGNCDLVEHPDCPIHAPAEDLKLVMPQTILSLCDYTGIWSGPYEEAGYDVVRVDLEHGQDVRLLTLPSRPVHGIIAQPPCTVFANSGARWPRSEDEMREGLSIVDACLRFVVACKPLWWVLENPTGKLKHYLGPPKWTFNPNDYGDPYTKLTCLWGEFCPPPKNPVPATEGSKMHRVGPGPNRARIRSATPEGFARAFFARNP